MGSFLGILIVIVIGFLLIKKRTRKKKLLTLYANNNKEYEEMIKEYKELDKIAPLEYYDRITNLKRMERYEEAIPLGMKLIERSKRQVQMEPNFNICSKPYKELAIIYRKKNDFIGEVSILEDYVLNSTDRLVDQSELASRYVKLVKNSEYEIPSEVKSKLKLPNP